MTSNVIGCSNSTAPHVVVSSGVLMFASKGVRPCFTSPLSSSFHLVISQSTPLSTCALYLNPSSLSPTLCTHILVIGRWISFILFSTNVGSRNKRKRNEIDEKTMKVRLSSFLPCMTLLQSDYGLYWLSYNMSLTYISQAILSHCIDCIQCIDT